MKDILADNFTKAWGKLEFENHRTRIGITLIKEEIIIELGKLICTSRNKKADCVDIKRV